MRNVEQTRTQVEEEQEIMSGERIEVQHLPDQKRFVIPLENSLAILDYERDANRIDFTRTWVPPEFRGGDHARILVREGLNWARDQGLEICASCWYVARFLKNNCKD